MKRYLGCAAVATMAVLAGPAQAADLGGNCCADLEERIAELEATTARKGNRKVSLTISGWVNEAVFWWDDGVESNTYVGTNSLEQSRFKLSGEAKIVDGWSAGYVLELGVQGAASSKFSQATADSTSNAITLRKSNWFIKSKDLGKVTVGLEGTATYHLLDDADGVSTRNYADAEGAAVALGAFATLTNGKPNGLLWTDVLRGANNSTPGQSGRRDIVRYDSPTFAGFVISAAWGEDDTWDAALSYKGDVGDFKVTARAGYANAVDEFTLTCHSIKAPDHSDCTWWGGAATVQHAPTGLYVYAGYGEQQDDTRSDQTPKPATTEPTADDTDTMWFVQAGIEQKFVALGKTTIFGEFRNDDAGSNPAKKIGGSYVHDSNIDSWAAGVVQNIDAAAMDLYVIYRHSDGDTTNGAGQTFTLDDFDMVITGGRITF